MASHPLLYSLLGIAVFERTAPGDFQALGDPPKWWDRLVKSWGDPFTNPFVEDYLVVADRFWMTESNGLSPPEVFQVESGDATVTLEISATNADGSQYLMVRSLDSGSVGITEVLQTARDRHLRHTQEIDEHVELQVDLSRAKEAAELLSQAKTQFLANVSHEIRTPLTAILGMADLLADTQLDDDQRKFVETMQSSSDHLLRIMNDLLDFSRVESGHFELEAIPIDLQSFASQLDFRFATRAKTKGLRYSVEVGEDVPKAILSDPVRLSQITDNLIANSLKFTDSGHVRVHFELNPRNHDELLIMVADTGIGIPEDKQELIFHSFVQEDASTTRRFGGTGLGLAIVRQLTSVMGGTVALESRLGEGTTFFVTLPLALELAQSEQIDDQSGDLVASAKADQDPSSSVVPENSNSDIDQNDTGTDRQSSSGLQTAALFDSIEWDEKTPNPESTSHENKHVDVQAESKATTVDFGWSDGNAEAGQQDWASEGNQAQSSGGDPDWYTSMTTSSASSTSDTSPLNGNDTVSFDTKRPDATESGRDGNDSKVADTDAKPTSASDKAEAGRPQPDESTDHRQQATAAKRKSPLRKRYDDEPIESFLAPVSKRDTTSVRSVSNRNGPPKQTFRKPNDPSQLRVLLAEDNDAIRMLLTRMLEKLGHVVVIAGNGQEAIDNVSDEIDLVLMDCQMPVMDGYQASQEIRSQEIGGTLRLPIIALTAHAMAGFREKCIAHGMDDYLTKPLNQTELESLIAKTLRVAPQPG